MGPSCGCNASTGSRIATTWGHGSRHRQRAAFSTASKRNNLVFASWEDQIANATGKLNRVEGSLCIDRQSECSDTR